jgi:hypothetical protein
MSRSLAGEFFFMKKTPGQGVFFHEKNRGGTTVGNRFPRDRPKLAGGFDPD